MPGQGWTASWSTQRASKQSTTHCRHATQASCCKRHHQSAHAYLDAVPAQDVIQAACAPHAIIPHDSHQSS